MELYYFINTNIMSYIKNNEYVLSLLINVNENNKKNTIEILKRYASVSYWNNFMYVYITKCYNILLDRTVIYNYINYELFKRYIPFDSLYVESYKNDEIIDSINNNIPVSCFSNTVINDDMIYLYVSNLINENVLTYEHKQLLLLRCIINNCFKSFEYILESVNVINNLETADCCKYMIFMNRTEFINTVIYNKYVTKKMLLTLTILANVYGHNYSILHNYTKWIVNVIKIIYCNTYSEADYYYNVLYYSMEYLKDYMCVDFTYWIMIINDIINNNIILTNDDIMKLFHVISYDKNCYDNVYKLLINNTNIILCTNGISIKELMHNIKCLY